VTPANVTSGPIERPSRSRVQDLWHARHGQQRAALEVRGDARAGDRPTSCGDGPSRPCPAPPQTTRGRSRPARACTARSVPVASSPGGPWSDARLLEPLHPGLRQPGRVPHVPPPHAINLLVRLEPPIDPQSALEPNLYGPVLQELELHVRQDSSMTCWQEDPDDRAAEESDTDPENPPLRVAYQCKSTDGGRSRRPYAPWERARPAVTVPRAPATLCIPHPAKLPRALAQRAGARRGLVV